MSTAITFLVMILFSSSFTFMVYQLAMYTHEKQLIRKTELTDMRHRIRCLEMLLTLVVLENKGVKDALDRKGLLETVYRLSYLDMFGETHINRFAYIFAPGTAEGGDILNPVNVPAWREYT